jgi:hypothetical protein
MMVVAGLDWTVFFLYSIGELIRPCQAKKLSDIKFMGRILYSYIQKFLLAILAALPGTMT